jgi:hypothetical protein
MHSGRVANPEKNLTAAFERIRTGENCVAVDADALGCGDALRVRSAGDALEMPSA